ncbi:MULTISPECIES: OmpA family protein [unclassified Vibrio]|uniref:OmpA family protein n=1 Tax=unclassified Vibrio TaxID=2614977 RepID=UPI001361CB0B|nr:MULTISPECIES: OmpA family protein [unclassified Vibrio]NAW58190.1 OmpA family protein [Vibrio sp. V36_P2S2PM302]NAX24638.1 OmpA family protein [Vibrio sp. V38_P2S17PM301]
MKKLAAVISASLLMASTSAMAQVYVGAKVGKTWLDDACISGQPCDDEDSTLGAFAGYEWNKYFALEAGYDYLGEFNTGTAGLNGSNDDVSAITLAPKLSLPLTDDISLYGKFGGAYVDYGSKNDWSYLGAAGLEINSHQNVTVRLEYQTITDMNNDRVRAAGNSATLGVVYKFGGQEAAPAPVVVEEEPVVAEPQPVTKTFETKTLGTGNFALNSTELKAESAAQLDDLVAFLNQHPQANVEIVGYTDTSGSAAYNQKISEKRAQSVAKALNAKGIDSSRIATRGEGENNPVADNSTREGRAKNRRVEIVVPAFEYTVQQ